MKKHLLIASVTAGIVLTACAATAQQANVVLTPTALYGMIEKLEVKIGKLINVATKNNIRVQAIEARLAKLEANFKAENQKNIELGISPVEAEVQVLREQVKKLDSKIIKQTKKITELENKLVQEHLRVSEIRDGKQK